MRELDYEGVLSVLQGLLGQTVRVTVGVTHGSGPLPVATVIGRLTLAARSDDGFSESSLLFGVCPIAMSDTICGGFWLNKRGFAQAYLFDTDPDCGENVQIWADLYQIEIRSEH